MKKLSEIKTRQQILDLQKNDTLTITLTKRQARIIGFAIGTEIDGYDKCITSLQKDLENITNENDKKLIEESIIGMYETTKELVEIQENLKKFYGFLVD